VVSGFSVMFFEASEIKLGLCACAFIGSVLLWQAVR
jgi:hypothetical protein